MIPVSKPYLPSLPKYAKQVEGIFGRAWLTNHGPLVGELTERLKSYLGVEHLLLVANGTLALEVAFRALRLEGEVITTPFSFAATTSSLLWTGLRPVFADVDPRTLNLDPEAAKARIGPNVSAILPVHVFGAPCQPERFEAVASAAGVKLVFDAAHAFGVKVGGESVLRWGDASTLSFHATKLFHTVEGGGIVFRDPEVYERARRMIDFGFPATADGRIPEVGINAKLSEMHAAMGLGVLDDIASIIEARLERVALYRSLLDGVVELLPAPASDVEANGGYMPILLEGFQSREAVGKALEEAGVTSRRYFWPSLETAYSQGPGAAAHATRATERTLCLPLFHDLPLEDVKRICSVVAGAVGPGLRSGVAGAASARTPGT